LNSFDSVIVRIETERGTGFGEATDVRGYFTGTLDDAWNFACLHGPELVGKNPDDALAHITDTEQPLSFAATPLVTALENTVGFPERSPGESASLPILGVVQGESFEEITDDAHRLMDEGYHTLKFKVGFSVPKDLERVRHLQKHLRPGVHIRIDANQGYSYSQSVDFLKALNPEGIELLEQPMGMDAWDDMMRLTKISPVPLMLDESIRGEKDLDRTIETGCAGVVKFKLMKCGSFRYLEKLIKKAVDAGLKVILGNGVATDIGCAHEALIALRTGLTTHAGEMNGFLKGIDHYLEPPLCMEGERLIIPVDAPNVRWEKLSRYTTEEMNWGEIKK
jgi:o-succinylbenzoate synthase